MTASLSVVIPAAPDSKLRVIDSLRNQQVKINQIIVYYGKNPSKNRNKGLEKSKGEFVAFVNGHSSFPADWSKKVLEFFSNHPEIDIVGGPQLTPLDSSFFEKASGYALNSIFGSAGIRKRYGSNQMKLNADEEDLTSANLICKREVFQKIKFDESIYPGEDPKFIEEAKAAHLNIAYSPDIISYNQRRNSLIELSRQIFTYGKVRPQKESILKTLNRAYFLVPSLFFIYLLSLIPLLLFSYSLLWLTPLFLYLGLDIMFSLIESTKNKNLAAFFPLLIIFPAIHLSYGLGFIVGFSMRTFISGQNPKGK